MYLKIAGQGLREALAPNADSWALRPTRWEVQGVGPSYKRSGRFSCALKFESHAMQPLYRALI